jgi:hypothetical protein
MEVYRVNAQTYNNTKLILKATGNSRLQVLRDYENKLIDKSHIYYSHGNLFLEASDLSNLLDRPFHKCYIQFHYIDTRPVITDVWKYDEYAPLDTLHAFKTNIKQSTYIDLKITQLIEFDHEEFQKNSLLNSID